jgi:hypothetical protein
MKWRAGKADWSDAAPAAVLWARSAHYRLWRILPCDGGYWVPGITRAVGWGRRERRTYRTVYGARMAAECEKRRGA